MVAAAVLLPASAGAAGIAYIDNHNVWLSSPDGAKKFQVTTNGTQDVPWNFPVQGPDGKTIASHRDAFQNEDGTESRRPVLYLWGADGKQITANVMPVYSGANIPVYPIGMDMDWNSQAVAYGYSYCTFACNSVVQGYWLTFSDNQGLYPSDPQGQSDAYFPTFLGKRVVSSDSGGNVFVQPDVPEAPFTSSYTGWLDHPVWHLSRTEVAMTGRMVAIEWFQSDGQNIVAEGIVVGQHQGTVPSDVTDLCQLPVGGDSTSVSISPDGTQIAWSDAEGVKVAGVPNLAAGTDTCTLTAPPAVISPSGRNPSFGGVDVAKIVDPPPAQTPATAPGATPNQAPVAAAAISAKVAGRATTAAFKKGLKLTVQAPAAGRVDASASVPASVGRKLRLGRPTTLQARLAAAKGMAAAKGVVVARGRATAKAAGPVTLTLRPTAKARRAARRLRGKTLTVKVGQGPAVTTLRVKLR